MLHLLVEFWWLWGKCTGNIQKLIYFILLSFIPPSVCTKPCLPANCLHIQVGGWDEPYELDINSWYTRPPK